MSQKAHATTKPTQYLTVIAAALDTGAGSVQHSLKLVHVALRGIEIALGISAWLRVARFIAYLDAAYLHIRFP